MVQKLTNALFWLAANPRLWSINLFKAVLHFSQSCRFITVWLSKCPEYKIFLPDTPFYFLLLNVKDHEAISRNLRIMFLTS